MSWFCCSRGGAQLTVEEEGAKSQHPPIHEWSAILPHISPSLLPPTLVLGVIVKGGGGGCLGLVVSKVRVLTKFHCLDTHYREQANKCRADMTEGPQHSHPRVELFGLLSLSCLTIDSSFSCRSIVPGWIRTRSDWKRDPCCWNSCEGWRCDCWWGKSGVVFSIPSFFSDHSYSPFVSWKG